MLAVYALLTMNDIPGAQKIYTAIRRRNPKYEGLKDLNTSIEARAADIKKQEDALKANEEANVRAAAALEEEKKRTAAAQKEAEDAKSTPLTVLPGGAYVAPSAPPSPAVVGEAERPEIDKLVQQWARVLGTRNVAAISNIRSFSKEEAESWQRLYKNYKQIEVIAEIKGTPEVIDNHALVPIEEVMITTQNNGIKVTGQPRRTTYRMQKIGGQWKMLAPTTPMPSSSQ